MFPPSSGTAYINGHDICKDIKGVRSSLGLCPQHDILFDELTVEEHMYFFCRVRSNSRKNFEFLIFVGFNINKSCLQMKGMSERKVPFEVTRMVNCLGLQAKRHAEAHTLSGGMKRKLSVGIALCAGSKVCIQILHEFFFL